MVRPAECERLREGDDLSEKRPNILFIMTDNHAAWTLGCYGNRDIRTPNIDRLAAEGMRFSQAYCVNSVCSPSRATWLTGRIPSQHGVHCYLGGEKPDAQMGPDAYCTIEEFDNLPRILSDNGYRCGLSGKWHLGDSLRPQLGFTNWMTKPKGHTRTFYGDELIRDGAVYEEDGYTTDVITEHAVAFLRDRGEDPFFLYVPYNGPYGLGDHMTSVHENRHTAYYAGKELPSFPREPVHPWLFHNKTIINNPVSIRGYAAALSAVDDGVGTLLDTVDEIGATENTLVIFTSDQGLCGGHHGLWGMGDHSRPLHAFEETIHIPQIVRHPGRVPAGSVFEGRTCNYDFLPSVVDYVGLGEALGDRGDLPGRNYAEALAGNPVEWDGEIFHEFESLRLVRNDRWKYVRRHPGGPDELYDMAADPGERANLADVEAFGDVREALGGRIDAFFARYADPEFDLWKGGRSKAGRILTF